MIHGIPAMIIGVNKDEVGTLVGGVQETGAKQKPEYSREETA
jgi:hypothetical protein